MRVLLKSSLVSFSSVVLLACGGGGTGTTGADNSSANGNSTSKPYLEGVSFKYVKSSSQDSIYWDPWTDHPTIIIEPIIDGWPKGAVKKFKIKATAGGVDYDIYQLDSASGVIKNTNKEKLYLCEQFLHSEAKKVELTSDDYYGSVIGDFNVEYKSIETRQAGIGSSTLVGAEFKVGQNIQVLSIYFYVLSSKLINGECIIDWTTPSEYSNARVIFGLIPEGTTAEGMTVDNNGVVNWIPSKVGSYTAQFYADVTHKGVTVRIKELGSRVITVNN